MKNFVKLLGILFVCSQFGIHVAIAQDAIPESTPFPDVEEGSRFYAPVEYFRAKNVISGYPDGTFRPNQEANRAEALKIILLASEIEVPELTGGLKIFPDVSLEDWFYNYVSKAKDTHIIDGYEDGTFKPAQVQNLAETLKIVFQANNISVEQVPPGTLIFPDVSDAVWFANFAAYAKEKNIIEPDNDGKMNAGNGITRGELLELMYRMDIVNQNNGQPFDISQDWPIEDFPEYAFQTKVPFTWQIIRNEDEIVLWRKDEINNQSSYEMSFPYSASMTFHLDKNDSGLSIATYQQKIENAYTAMFETYQKNDLTVGGDQAINLNVSADHDDFFVFVPNNYVLHIYTSYGKSDLTPQLLKEIEKILANTKYIALQENSSGDILSDVRSQILVEGVGQTNLDKFPDLINIETDTIGVGTGAIDYFYSEQYNVTLKYERASDTILDMQDGQTSAF
ncbi:S-layer homology domain-containing protein [Patescibacteria group bacterium]|nr:S-layer homology domain-containing protein [Patescibacteria group bacterium]